MRSFFAKREQTGLGRAHLAIAGLAALVVSGSAAAATDRRGERPAESIETRAAGEPMLAVVSLRSQRITVYDANGWILRAPVSSGQTGRETPAGIFSVLQKDADHHSNLYDDAFMPHMQRLTWSGIALHGGALPGYPASHGCVRMPFDFAARLFELTQLGLRVLVAPTDVAPVEIAHPALFAPKPETVALAAALVAQAEEAARKADQARSAAGAAYREASKALVPVRVAENLKRRAEAQLQVAEAALGFASSAEATEQAERDKAQLVARIAELQAQLDTAKAAQQPKLDAVAAAREAIVAAENVRVVAAEAAQKMTRELEPVSVLISRKTQRLYVRQGFEPILETPVTIQDPDRPIGTHVFTVMERISSDNMRWNVVTLDAGGSARAALDRIVIPQEALDRIAGIGPRSSLIITDEALSAETGKGTDFVVVLSSEPQGGIKMRRRGPGA
jgi:hypothetical protein